MPATTTTNGDVNPGLSLPVILSPTRVELGARCLRRHILSDLLHLRAYDSPSAAFGTQMHLAVDAWWRHTLDGDSPVVSLEAALDALEPWPDAATYGYHSLDLARTLVTEYSANGRLAANSPYDDWELLDAERRYVLQYVDHETGRELILTFKMDRVLASHERGVLCVVDTKTSANPGDKWAAGMRTSIQQRLYNQMAFDLYGLPVTEHWVEGIDKKGKATRVGGLVYLQVDELWTQAYTQEALDLAYHVASLDEVAVQAALADAATSDEADQQLLELALTKAPFNLQDCHSYYTPCEFLDLCQASPDERVALVAGSQLYRGEPWQLEAVGLAADSLPTFAAATHQEPTND